MGAYDETDRMLAATFADFDSNGTELSLSGAEGAAYFKAFIWDENSKAVVEAVCIVPEGVSDDSEVTDVYIYYQDFSESGVTDFTNATGGAVGYPHPSVENGALKIVPASNGAVGYMRVGEIECDFDIQKYTVEFDITKVSGEATASAGQTPYKLLFAARREDWQYYDTYYSYGITFRIDDMAVGETRAYKFYADETASAKNIFSNAMVSVNGETAVEAEYENQVGDNAHKYKGYYDCGFREDATGTFLIRTHAQGTDVNYGAAGLEYRIDNIRIYETKDVSAKSGF